MSQLSSYVSDLFEKDKALIALDKEIKVKNAQYQHLLLKNAERIYSDSEVMAINTAYAEIGVLEEKKSQLKSTVDQVKDYLKSKLAPLSGGRWVHETEDPIHPRWEFWVEDDELKYARMNGASY